MIVTPGHLQNLASLLEARSRQLMAIGDDLASTAQNAAWAGPAGDRYRAAMRDRRAELRREVDRLTRVAGELRRTSSDLDTKIRECRRIETNVRQWFAANRTAPQGQVPRWQGWRWTPYSRFPAPGSPEWLAIRDYFAGKGLRV